MTSSLANVEATYDDQLEAANRRIAELQEQVAAVEGEQENEAPREPDLAEQLRRVDAAIDAAAREAGEAALRGDNDLAKAATERQARLFPLRDALLDRKAKDERAASAAHVRNQLAQRHAETTEAFDATLEEIDAASARLPEGFAALARDCEIVLQGPGKLAAITKTYLELSEAMRVAAAADGVMLDVPPPPTAMQRNPALNYDDVEKVSEATGDFLIAGNRFPRWVLNVVADAQRSWRAR